MYAITQADQAMNMETLDALIERVMPLAREVDVANDCTPDNVGALNSVAAAGGEFSETTVQLFVLRSRGDITEQEYEQLVLHFINSES